MRVSFLAMPVGAPRCVNVCGLSTQVLMFMLANMHAQCIQRMAAHVADMVNSSCGRR